MKTKLNKALLLISALTMGLSVTQSIFNEVQATGGGNSNNRKAIKDNSGHFDCKCKESGSDCRCMVS